MNTIRLWSANNWFLLALPCLLAVSFLFVRSPSSAGPIEAVTLFDWCVSVPLLYFRCYRRSLPLRQMALRLVALGCGGLWLASRLVPSEAQDILPHLGWLRTAGLIVLGLIELKLLVLATRMAFSGKADAARLAASTGTPPLLAKLMLAEARFWQAVWRLIRRR